MPTPLEIMLDPLSLIIIGMYLMLMLWEWKFPARKLPHIGWWKLKGIFFFLLFFFLSSYVPMLIDPILSRHTILDLSGLHPFFGALIGVLLYELGVYVWHRSMHRSNFLWRTFHQMHHSAERVDTYGAFFFSPLDMIGYTFLGSVCFALLIGLDPKAITAILLTTNFMAIFQHANITTPRWMGFLIQRPESHAYHHAKGIHRCNYSDLPIFDMLFGTFENPQKFSGETGFYDGASHRILDMLFFRDVTMPKKENK